VVVSPGSVNVGPPTVVVCPGIVDVSAPDVVVCPGSVDVEAPNVVVSPGSVDVEAPNVVVCPGSVDVEAPNVVVCPGSVDVEAPNVVVCPGSVDVEAPNVVVCPGSVDVEAPNVVVCPADVVVANVLVDEVVVSNAALKLLGLGAISTPLEFTIAPLVLTVTPTAGAVNLNVLDTVAPGTAFVEPAIDIIIFVTGSNNEPSERTIFPTLNPVAFVGRAEAAVFGGSVVLFKPIIVPARRNVPFAAFIDPGGSNTAPVTRSITDPFESTIEPTGAFILAPLFGTVVGLLIVDWG
jgi:hypothetical protein